MGLPEAMSDQKVDAARTADACAIQWLLRLRSGHATVADAHAYVRWRVEDPEHERAARDLALLWRMLAEAAQASAFPPCACLSCASRQAPGWTQRRGRRSSLRRRHWHSTSGR